MKTYFKAFFLLLLIYSCTPEEELFFGALTTQVQPANSGTIGRISKSNSNVVQLYAVPAEYYFFKGWKPENSSDPLITENNIFVVMDTDKIVTAVFELKDTDEDGVTDDIDLCPNTPNGETVDSNGCNKKTFVPDDIFEQYLIDRGWDDVLDNYVLTSNIDDKTHVYLYNKGIEDLTGIEDFSSLQYLDVRYNKFTSLDLSKNTNLETLYCGNNNQLTSLNLGTNTTLSYLNAKYTSLTSLDLRGNTGLTNIDLYNYYYRTLTSLILGQKPNLTTLNVGYNKLTSLDVSGCPNLQSLKAYYNDLTSLNLGTISSLTYLHIIYNELTSLDLSRSINLQTVYAYHNELTSLDVSNNAALTYINVTSQYYHDASNTLIYTLECLKVSQTQLDNINNHTLNFFESSPTVNWTTSCN